MPKGFFTQGFAVLLDRAVPVSELAALLPKDDVVKENSGPAAEQSSDDDWALGGPSRMIVYRPDINGHVSLDVVDRPWPDHMGSPDKEPMLFTAWTMGHFGPYNFPGALGRAAHQSWAWEGAADAASEHRAFARLRTSYVFGAAKDAPVIPKGVDPTHELNFLTERLAALLDHPAAIGYFNPNGELLLDQIALEDSLRYHLENDLPAFDVWSNVRLYSTAESEDDADAWAVMDTVGNWQLDLPDQEVVLPPGFDTAGLEGFLRSITLYLHTHGLVIQDGDTIEGPGGVWQAWHLEEPLADPPRATMRWLPKGVEVPDHLLSNLGKADDA